MILSVSDCAGTYVYMNVKSMINILFTIALFILLPITQNICLIRVVLSVIVCAYVVYFGLHINAFYFVDMTIIHNA